MDIERIRDCIPQPNIAKSEFYNFESGAFNHSATLPFILMFYTICMKTNSSDNTEQRWQKTPAANLIRHVQSGNYYARIRVRGKLIWKLLKTAWWKMWHLSHIGFQRYLIIINFLTRSDVKLLWRWNVCSFLQRDWRFLPLNWVPSNRTLSHQTDGCAGIISTPQ